MVDKTSSFSVTVTILPVPGGYKVTMGLRAATLEYEVDSDEGLVSISRPTSRCMDTCVISYPRATYLYVSLISRAETSFLDLSSIAFRSLHSGGKS